MEIVINNLTARRIACDWHSGQTSPLYALCSTGTITTDGYTTYREITDAIGGAFNTSSLEDIDELVDLAVYVEYHGPRAPVEGWNDLRW